MSVAEQPRERDRAFERYLTFLDAVVAIAITLLVLPLTELGADLGAHESVAHLLRENQWAIWSFLLSFFVIANMWFVQHRVLHSLDDMNGAIARLLLVWVLAIVVLPFVTELVAKAGEDPATKVLYFGAITLAEVCIASISVAMRRHPELTDGTVGPSVGAGWVNVALMLAAAALSIGIPSLSYWPLLLLLADDLVLGLGRRVLGR